MKSTKPIQINIPNPCSEDWSKMGPTEKGRFCSHCQKSVIDFTKFSDKAIFEYITQYKRKHICGRFYDTQLNRPINIPPQPNSRLYRYFIGLGLTLVFAQLPNSATYAKTPHNFETLIVNNLDDTTKNLRNSTENNPPLFSENNTPGTDRKKPDPIVYIIDGVRVTNLDRVNIVMGALAEAPETPEYGTPASRSGSIDEPQPPLFPTEKLNRFNRR